MTPFFLSGLILAGCVYGLYDDARPEFASDFSGISGRITGASISFVYSEVYCPWGACSPKCILHLCLLSYQPRITPNKHGATANLHK